MKPGDRVKTNRRDAKKRARCYRSGDLTAVGPLPGQFDGVHQIDVDQEGNLYVTEVANDRSQMFRPKPKADPAKLIRPMVGRRSNTPKPILPKV